jgi:hypothetical protein
MARAWWWVFMEGGIVGLGIGMTMMMRRLLSRIVRIRIRGCGVWGGEGGTMKRKGTRPDRLLRIYLLMICIVCSTGASR